MTHRQYSDEDSENGATFRGTLLKIAEIDSPRNFIEQRSDLKIETCCSAQKTKLRSSFNTAQTAPPNEVWLLKQ